VNTIRNETRDKEYDRRGYLYTPPMVELAMSNVLNLEQHITLEAGEFLDVFGKIN